MHILSSATLLRSLAKSTSALYGGEILEARVSAALGIDISQLVLVGCKGPVVIFPLNKPQLNVTFQNAKFSILMP